MDVCRPVCLVGSPLLFRVVRWQQWVSGVLLNPYRPLQQQNPDEPVSCLSIMINKVRGSEGSVSMDQNPDERVQNHRYISKRQIRVCMYLEKRALSFNLHVHKHTFAFSDAASQCMQTASEHCCAVHINTDFLWDSGCTSLHACNLCILKTGSIWFVSSL